MSCSDETAAISLSSRRSRTKSLKDRSAFVLGRIPAALQDTVAQVGQPIDPSLTSRWGLNRVPFESSNSCGLGWAVRVPIWSRFIGGDQIS